MHFFRKTLIVAALDDCCLLYVQNYPSALQAWACFSVMTGYTLHLASQKKMAPRTPQTVRLLAVFLDYGNIAFVIQLHSEICMQLVCLHSPPKSVLTVPFIAQFAAGVHFISCNLQDKHCGGIWRIYFAHTRALWHWPTPAACAEPYLVHPDALVWLIFWCAGERLRRSGV